MRMILAYARIHRHPILGVLLLIVLLWPGMVWAADAAPITDATITAYFAPHGGCTEAVVEATRDRAAVGHLLSDLSGWQVRRS